MKIVVENQSEPEPEPETKLFGTDDRERSKGHKLISLICKAMFE
jgi:hypothetical protein